ncbi:MAG: hypoxanthine phosphoribosyltransferase [Bacteroidales bacterium]|jgi:hypoxanthine phosphoribosyltransferase|nr:hypoxanthine phosphoribosyltransferase [Bacteroidales bacterium]MCB9027893.1 hypoxanthine phosphoribosyltransferase [Bacteroidales bacterium]NLD64202.1 hypoxanthine phosphoribosyltransferase [Bacteroidales bacterium]HOO66699.1 hypoxanthine phosphoribosyltransferase [Bacteroidales bacterium]HPE22795.1 hypoxanthine phosphoribosyltransferase [Bacteroidales bacterium]
MNEITLLDREFSVYITEDEIQSRITALAEKINEDLKGQDILFFGVLNGVFLFAADIFRQITLDCQVSFIKLASYDGTSSTGKIKELIGWNEDITGKTVVVLEDIVDTGATLERVIGELKLRKAADIKICTLLFKPEAYTRDIPIDYIGFEIPNNFVVGYGLDYDGYGRNLRAIYKLTK